MPFVSPLSLSPASCLLLALNPNTAQLVPHPQAVTLEYSGVMIRNDPPPPKYLLAVPSVLVFLHPPVVVYGTEYMER